MPVFPSCSTLQCLLSMLRSSVMRIPLCASRGVQIPTPTVQKKRTPGGLLLAIGVAFLAAVHPMPSQAAQWRILGTTYGGQFYPGWSFEDGQYTANDSSVFSYNMATSLALPSATSGNITTLRFADWSALYPQMTPPYVDLATSTINLSSLVQEPWTTTYNPCCSGFSAWYSYTRYDVSYNIGALIPTPFTANGDGTYTATWITPDPLNGYPFGGGITASITFALASSVNLNDPGITDSGDVSKVGNDVHIGTNATGTRTVERKPHVFDNVLLGNAQGITGNLVIRSVPESRTEGELTATLEMVIGNSGTGAVSIESLGGSKYTPTIYARLTGSSIVLGKQAGAVGTLTSLYGGSVSAQGSNGIVTVGDAGSGTVNLTSTALSSTNLVLGSQVTGIGQIDAVASSLSLVGNGTNLSIGRGGEGSLTLRALQIGSSISGSVLRVTDPVNASANIFIGQYPGSQGTLNVCGECTLVADTLRIGLDENDAPGGAGLVNLYTPLVYAPTVFTPKLVKIGPNGVFTQYGAFDTLPSPLPSLNFDLVNQGAFSPVYFGLNGNVTNSGIFEHRQAFWVPIPFTFEKNFTQTANGILKIAALTVDPYFGGVPYKVLGAANLDGAIEIPGSQIIAPGLYPLIEDTNGIAVGPNFRVLTPNLPAGYSTETVIAPTLISLLVTSMQADLSLSLTASASTVLQGQTVNYSVTVTNNGPGPATGITLSGLPGCILDSSTLASGASTGCTASVTASTVGTLTQSVSVSGNEVDPNTANNNASVSTTVNPAANLALSMTDSPDPVRKRSKLVYTLTVVNNGPSSANNVLLTDILPADVIFGDAVPSQGTCSGTATVICGFGALGGGATATVTITVKPKVTGTITNSATVGAAEADPDAANNSVAETTLVSGGKP